MNKRTIGFTNDHPTTKEYIPYPKFPIEKYSAIITGELSDEQKALGEEFAREIKENYVTDFEKENDKMVHVSTFIYLGDYIYMTYYANTDTEKEDPKFQKARFAYCRRDDVKNKTVIDVQSVGEDCYGKKVELVYDSIMMKKDENTIYVLWTAMIEGNYYRLYRIFDVKTKSFGDVFVNRLKVGDIANDFSTTGMINAFTENGIRTKTMLNDLGDKTALNDIGIMQKISKRVENGETYYYTGAYSGDLSFIIKSTDFEVWEYVSMPDFNNKSEWENAVYVIGDKCFYFVRQYADSKYSFLTAYDLKNKTWDTPVLVEDSQSRGDFIFYDGGLYVFHAPVDREHIGIVKVDTDDISKSRVILQADMKSSCFYPYVDHIGNGRVGFSYTVDRKHIRLSGFDMKKYVK